MEHFHFFDFRDGSQLLWDDILENHKDAAQLLADKLVAGAVRDENGCRIDRAW